MALPILCPLCAAPLTLEGRALRCPNRHSFDMAREGYVNLLGAQKAGRVLGDSREMLTARRTFLEAGFYQLLSDAVNRMVEAHLAPDAARVVLDVGCGEGYYLGNLKAHLDEAGFQDSLDYVGLDISKEAARLAARKYPDILFLVADTWHSLLFADESVHLLLNIFAPRNAAEFARVSAPGARLLVVVPRPDHLAELRGEIELLEIEESKEQRIMGQMEAHFALIEREELQIPLNLGQAELLNLIGMTPSHRHLQAPVGEVQARHVTAAFTLLLFEKTP